MAVRNLRSMSTDEAVKFVNEHIGALVDLSRRWGNYYYIDVDELCSDIYVKAVDVAPNYNNRMGT